jgi:hypothetical protein
MGQLGLATVRVVKLYSSKFTPPFTPLRASLANPL